MALVFSKGSRPTLIAISVAAVLAACSTPEPPAPEPAPPPPPPPPVALNQGVADAAAIYVAFVREIGTIQAGGFQDAESIQAAIRKGSAYDPAQLSRGMIAYGAILALQSDGFVAGVREYAVDPDQRREIVDSIIRNPAYAATLPGADAAAGLIAARIGQDAAALGVIATGVQEDAYTIQERRDPRRRWAVQHLTNREERLEAAKALSLQPMLPSAEEAALLFAAAHSGEGLTLDGAALPPPYTPAIVNSLAIAALAALGAGGDDYRTYTEALAVETNSEFCLSMSKLMLFQCLAASRPSYEDMFCLGRHIVGDLAACAAQNAGPGLTQSPVLAAEAPAVAAEAAAASSDAVASATVD
ncbi:MAG TPA: hypothetical protein VGN74_01825 [Brevundimonas sp.]|jgi:hypothetical protein|uniref:hypothetical protein n=1 Tax=Brevundimonas sp. TaxID=1871086 RepID=UPI002E105D12|nr:hypothetical protein [Brevundimonas sp.]